MTDDHVIGIENRLPWHLPADMRWFREQTMGKPIVMGRKTFESFGAKPLPGRTNIIITQDRAYQAAGCVVVHSVEAALEAAGHCEEIMIIGGASLYAQTLARADRLYLTFVHARVAGDAWFPDFNPGQWREVRRIDREADEKHKYPYSFVVLERAAR
ncbi:MAG: dihydrofolate reductase [Gammaproteobacteria bacterium SG8_47]|nr:MAG: dihydrofolate reductase [Gammaproteobacteria bacterium SG8_47]